ncbi:hypothetical protein J421_3948 [Gemmatirosa kalamazoonensis]|uniref:ATP synthase I chain n=1 Tax=Gemmatirosa kalamazoonensis TaxID=861299 RepID=W0RME0_9BACT|nr:hypothetical protein [Gemmatirosa kalamazoonensis]AHG91485.1 hypothetical protein J421_3948 [Gemmatirosa kalamazoonensis]
MKALALFAGAALAIVAVAGLVLTLVWPSPEAARAIRVSAIVAFVVQLFAFGIMRVARRSNPVAAWGLGMLLRFAVFVLYAFVFVKSLALVGGPALASLALFFFLSTLVEPLLLNV